jgi:hypothetical protein
MAYSILSLDGGGSWALIQVKILQQRYGMKAKGHDILKKYDLVIANSGGSLVLAAMIVNKSLDEILNMFLDEEVLETIFVKKTISIINPLHKFFPRFKTKEKIKGLKAQLGENSTLTLNEIPAYIGKPSLQIIITAFDYDRERAIYFRSNTNSRMETSVIQSEVNEGQVTDTFKTTTLLNAVHAASNAPVLFFDDPAEFSLFYPSNPNKVTSKRRFWDGAVGGNNNPVASGVLEAIANGANPNEIRIVSIGTANTVLPVLYGDSGEPIPEISWLIKIGENEGPEGDILKMAQAIISDPPDAATFIANQILNLPYQQRQNRLIRINPLVKPIFDSTNNMWRKPGVQWLDKKMQRLFEMDMAVTDSDDIQLINRMTEEFFDGYFDNQGIRTGGAGIEAILGHKNFKSALDDWNSWEEQVNPLT